jgi:hypothetical protein
VNHHSVNGFDVLAIIGGVTGPVASLAAVLSVTRDRPRLRLDVGFSTSIAHPPRMWIDLYNDGRQPLTIREAGLYGSRFPVGIRSQEHGEVRGTAFYTFKVLSDALLLDAGHYKRVEAGIPDATQSGYHVDHPLRVYAIDARGRWIWGQAAPVVRIMIGHGPRPSFINAAQWDATTTPLEPARVAPRWKLWVRRELRRGDEGRPSYDDLVKITRGG